MKINLKIGTQVYAVHGRYVDEKLQGGIVRVCRVKSYANCGGKVLPVLKEIGGKSEFDASVHYVYTDLEKAIEAITTKKSKRR